MGTQWFYTDQGQRLGPVSPEQLKQLVTSGRLQPSDMVWKEGMAQWVAASHVKGLFPEATLDSTPGSPPPLPVVSPLSGTKQATAVIPSSSTETSQQPPATGTRVCEWCAESISEKAFKCPHCQKWRRDIESDRRLYFGMTVGLFLLLLVIFGTIYGETPTGPPAFSGGAWHNVVSGGGMSLLHVFSVTKFLSSGSGWIVIASAAGFVYLAYKLWGLKDKLQRKTGSQWGWLKQ